MSKAQTQAKPRLVVLSPVFEGYFEKMLLVYGRQHQAQNWDKLSIEEKISLLKAQRRAQGIPESKGIPESRYGA